MVETIVLVTGGFDPIHSGHIAYFKSAKKLGDKLIVGLMFLLLIISNTCLDLLHLEL